MVITSVLAFIVVRKLWGWNWLLSTAVFSLFLIVDIGYFSANLTKIKDGGWFPLALGAIIFLLLTTWKRGRSLVIARLQEGAMPVDLFIGGIGEVPKVSGTAVFLTADPTGVPHALLHSLKHYKCLHERVVILHVNIHEEPYVEPNARTQIEHLNEQFVRMSLHFGFMDETDVPAALAACESQGLIFEPMNTSYFLGRETLIPRAKSTMAFWRRKLFITMFRNAGSSAAYFRIRPNRVVELGAQVEL